MIPLPSSQLRRQALALGMLSVMIAAVGGGGAAQAATCPARDFAGFFQAFSDSPAVQRAFTAADVDFTQMDVDAQPEPREVTRNVPLASIVFPIAPTTTEQARQGLETRVTEMSNGMIRAQLNKPDTDYQLVYIFRARSDCWELYAKVDTSL